MKDVLKNFLKYLSPYKLYLGLSIIFAILSISLSLFSPILIGNAIDFIIDTGNVNFYEISKTLTKLIFLSLIASGLQWLNSILINTLTYNVAKDIREQAFKKIHLLPLKYSDSVPHGDTINRIINDIDAISDGLHQALLHFFTSITTITVTLIFMASLNIVITFIVILLTPLSIFTSYFISKHSYKSFRKQLNAQGELSGYITEMLSNQKIVKTFGYENRAISHFQNINSTLYNSGIKAQFYSSLSNPATRFINTIIYTIVGVVGSLMLILNGNISVGEITSFLTYSNQYTKPFNEISAVLTQIQSAFISAKRVFAFLNEKNELNDSPNAIEIKNCSGFVDLNNVYFSYTPNIKLIENFNLSVEPGQRVAIVGPTGSGKTTLINLLMRFYDVNHGSIKIDNVPIRNIKLNNLRSLYGMVLQDTWLFTGTIAENISYGKTSASLDEIKYTATQAYAHNFISRLPNGYQTIITEDGDNLSQGEKQLISIARIMLMNPPMLILDEATSNIDAITELEIQKAFKKIMNGKTSFIVAHRLSTIREADIILVMNNGNIVEKGSHSDLLKQNGFYAKLYKTQFSNE